VVEGKLRAMNLSIRQRLDNAIQGDMHGVHYAVSIAIATALLWVTVHELAKSNPIWAISSMVATSDPLMKQALMFFRARLINTLLGCAVGLLFIVLGGSHLLKLPIAMAVTVLLSSYVVRVPTMWRQGPITAAFVIAAGIEHHAKTSAFQAGLNRVSEVLFGCIIGLLVGYSLSKVWPLPEDKPAAKAAAAK
jgi:uncharacterized membrane protein YccC